MSLRSPSRTSAIRPDDEARKAIGEALDETLVVEAAAGTGKTTELVRRILRVLATGRARMSQIVAVTFTEKAAGELKLRLREALEIERAQASGDERQRLENALETLEEAHVNTIHGFCADVLRERPVEARVDPMFTVLTDAQANALYTRAFRAWLQEALRDPPEALQRALGRTSSPAFGGMDDGPIDRLRRAGRQLAEWRDFPAAWRRPPFDLHDEIDRLVADLHRLARLTSGASSSKDNLYIDTDAVRRLSHQIELEQSAGAPDYVGWEGRLVDLSRDRGFSRPRKGSGYKFGKDVSRNDVLLARDALFADLQKFKRDADADLAAGLQQELAGATSRYQDLKTAAGTLDFADLLTRARDLIRDNEDVRRHLQDKFTRIFVDEFQDTDPIQAEILLMLSSGDPRVTASDQVRPVAGKLFIVGDPKQAIYRFRGTDVGTYWKVRDQLDAVGGQVLQLTTSYRSLPDIQRFVNAAFAEEMVANEATLQAGYVPLSEWRDPIADHQPAVVALPVPQPYSGRGPLKASGRAIEESIPDAVGAFIKWLIEKSGWTVGERTPDKVERQVPIRPQHIAVLFRRFVSFGEDITRRYIDAIEARAIPHLLVGGKAFHGREEVETIRAALAAIEWPDDELSVFAVLKGSLFAIEDAHLLEFHHRFRVFHPYRVPKELGGNSGRELALTAEPTTHLTPIADALRLLQDLHRRRNYRPVADTIGRLLTETRAHVGFILRPGGEQALANVLHVAELARQYEAGGGISFRGFIDELRTAAESEAAEAPILEESSDGVRLMTVHKAKGLEFPIVILADPTCKLSREDASRYLDPGRRLCALKIGGWAPRDLIDHEPEEVERDKAEGVRLAYVAATRARDLLVVPALGDSPWEGGWISPLNRAVYPPIASRRDPSRGPRCPVFKSKDSVASRPNDETAGPSTVSPGLHAMPGDYSIVWWDPSALDLDAPRLFGVRREDLIVKDVARNVVADGRGRYDTWRQARLDALEAGSTPSLTLATVREWAANLSNELPLAAREVDVTMSQLRRKRREGQDGQDGARVGGSAFGALVHGVLAQAPFDADDDALLAIASSEAKALALDDASASAAATAARDVLRHEVLVRARAAADRGACRRETPVTCRLPDGSMIEGVVDLAFEEDGAWTIVDYKTDREIETAGEDRYRRQVALYAMAIAQATGRRAAGVLLRI
jgi:ATP-dependent exoDNAse (exonuclease V) beta subunit